MPIRPQLRRPLWIAYILLSLWLAAVIPNRSAQARPVRQFSYADLVAESDVVVIATALSTVADKDREFDEEMRGDEEEVECVITSFRVDGIINGDWYHPKCNGSLDNLRNGCFQDSGFRDSCAVRAAEVVWY